MKFWTILIISFFIIAIKSPLTAQSVKDRKTVKKQEKADIDSLFIVYSLPINISYGNNITQPVIRDSLIALLRRNKYKYLDSSAYAQLFKAKFGDLIPMNTIEDMREIISKVESDKNYYTKKAESADPFAQQIQISFLKKDSGINYLNVKRWNLPNARKFRNWVFTYLDAEPPDQIASRILNSLISKNELQ